MRDIFTNFERASGQAINLQKSGIFFSKNTHSRVKETISSILQIHTPLNTGRALTRASLPYRQKQA